MKIEEAYLQIVEQQLDENLFKKVAATAAIAGATLIANPLHKGEAPAPSKTFNPEHSVQNIVDRYKVPREKAQHIVGLAQKYAKHPFPQAHHILGTIGVESSFNEKAKSNLKFDPAVGLMQVRPKVTGTSPVELKHIEGQIKHGSSLLHSLYQKTQNEDKAIQAYNIGLTSYNKGKRALNYLDKTKKETQHHLIDTEPLN